MKVITFSRYYPKWHPRQGQETNFVEKLWLALIGIGAISISKAVELSRQTGIGGFDMYNIRKCDYLLKFHTIRAGNRWKAGEQFSPRIWSGKPYNSKQVEIAPPITIAKTWDFEIHPSGAGTTVGYHFDDSGHLKLIPACDVAVNDGLECDDFVHWFDPPGKNKRQVFVGQNICWNPSINY